MCVYIYIERERERYYGSVAAWLPGSISVGLLRRTGLPRSFPRRLEVCHRYICMSCPPFYSTVDYTSSSGP